MRQLDSNPRFTNPLVNSSSLYLRQHAHNPVFWYPWGREAIERAKAENKPILLSIGYSSCYWCHVMERDVFQNLSIASSMNQLMINIKVDREERPDLDEIYMVARQIMTHEGGWPNNVFLTPDLKPFYAGGTFAADESSGRPAFPRIIEWINYSWSTQEQEVRTMADQITEAMKPHLIFTPPGGKAMSKPNVHAQAAELFSMLKEFHDGRSGGFFQAPKFPHECLLSFLLGYYEHTNSNEQPFEENVQAIDMVTKSLQKMAAGGIYDHVGAGFHRYAIDKDWLVPHFEKMLYNQAMLARVYTDAARLTGNEFFADIAKSVLDMVRGPFMDADGAFYSSFDAEVDEVEGAYYSWTPETLQDILSPDESGFLITFYALTDIPHFPGHKANKGQVLVARKSLDEAAKEYNVNYVQIASLTGQVMNKLLAERNMRQSPERDDKIIVSWNGLMIDAYAHAGKVFNLPNYLLTARVAADFLLEHAIDNDGVLHRVYANGQAHSPATLEDYAFLVKGLLTLWRATPDDILLEAAKGLMEGADSLFSETPESGYFYSQPSDRLIMRSRNCDDMVVPNANAIMVHNMIDLFEITNDTQYSNKAQLICYYFLAGEPKITPEAATMIHAAIRLETLLNGKILDKPLVYDPQTRVQGGESLSDDAVDVETTLTPEEPKPGSTCEVTVTLNIKEGWHINADTVNQSFLVPTQLDVQGFIVESHSVSFPEPTLVDTQADGPGKDMMPIFKGKVEITVKVKLKKVEARIPFKLMLRYQACTEETCYRVRDLVIPL